MLISYITNKIFPTKGTQKNVRIAEVVDVEVPANGNVTVISDFSLEDFPYHYVVCLANSSHTFKVNEQYKTGTFFSPWPAVTVIDTSDHASRRPDPTDWIKAKGEKVHIDVENLDSTNAHTYTIYVIGVR